MRLPTTIALFTVLAIAASTTALVAQHESGASMQAGAASPPSDGAMAAMAQAMHDGHMTMSPARPPTVADRARADRIVAALRVALAPYHDYRVAEADGYVPFHPEWKLPMYHFTNWRNAIANLASFDPARPTSLMYERVRGGYELVGAMYTAPRAATADELDARVPLSVATWHEHTNLCVPPPGMQREAFGPDARFGLAGSIVTADACAQAGGRFVPVIYNWMVHVWPFERDPSKVWASREHPGALER